MKRALLILSLCGTRDLSVADDSAQLPEVVVTADRLPTRPRDEPFSLAVVHRDELHGAPQLRLDDILRDAVPGFSLFRRSSSRVAHPTTQGVSLRNLGPNGAGRTLVLLDGIPLNDPFAGWVPWARVPPSSLDRVMVSVGGGAGLFGNAAIAGTIHLISPEPGSDRVTLLGTVGDRETYEASLDAVIASGKVSVSTFADRFSSGGYPVLQADQRGPVDTAADASSWVWQSRLDWQHDADTRLSLSVGAFEEERGNGTRLTHNAHRGQDFSVAWRRHLPTLDAEVRVQAYVQRRQFSSLFTSVNDDRSAEAPALDQFDVPATAAGGSVVWSQRASEAHQWVAGLDTRWVEGETNERFRRMGGRFAAIRNAGGRQLFVAAFFEESWKPSDAIRLVLGGRIDYWRQYDGSRVERDLASGALLQEARFAERDGVSPNGRLGITANLTRTVRVRGATFTGFRVPTLNELYRPFRVGNDITEANGALDPERLYGAELGVDWEPVQRFSFSVTGFYNQLRDAIGNVTIGEGPGVFTPGGFVPAGGVLRQRRNLDRVEVVGVEGKLVWRLADDWRLRAQYLYTHPTVERASEAPQLEGRRLAQAPEHVAVAAVDWTPGRWHASAQVRYVGQQYEDDLNTLSLAAFTSVDLALGCRFTEWCDATLRVENVFDTESEVGKSANGLVSIGAPRLVSLTVAVSF